MPEPLILITTHTINDGQLEKLRALSARFAELVETEAPGVSAFEFHLNDDASEVTNLQVHSDAASMEAYLPRAQPLIAEALCLTRTLTLDVYGDPGPIMQQAARTNAEQGARVRVHSHRLATGGSD